MKNLSAHQKNTGDLTFTLHIETIKSKCEQTQYQPTYFPDLDQIAMLRYANPYSLLAPD